MLLLLINVILLGSGSVLGTIHFYPNRAKRTSVRWNSFNLFPDDPQINRQKQTVVIPELNLETCELNTNSITRNYFRSRRTLVLILLREPCFSYTTSLSNWDQVVKKLKLTGYPPVGTIVWNKIAEDRQALGNPDSNLMSTKFIRSPNITYQVLTSPASIKLSIRNEKYNLRAVVINQPNPWNLSLTSSSVVVIKAISDLTKAILVGVLLFSLLVSLLKSRVKSKLILLLVVMGMTQLSGEVMISRWNSYGLRANLFIMSMLIIASICNQLILMYWYNTLQKLRVNFINHREVPNLWVLSGIFHLSLIFQFIWIILNHRRVGPISTWFPVLLIITLIFTTVIPLGLLIFFWRRTTSIFQIINPLTRSIHASWLRTLITLTHLSFTLLIIFTALQIQFPTTADEYVGFMACRDSFLILYQIAILFTVIQLSSLRPSSYYNNLPKRSNSLPRHHHHGTPYNTGYVTSTRSSSPTLPPTLLSPALPLPNTSSLMKYFDPTQFDNTSFISSTLLFPQTSSPSTKLNFPTKLPS